MKWVRERRAAFRNTETASIDHCRTPCQFIDSEKEERQLVSLHSQTNVGLVYGRGRKEGTTMRNERFTCRRKVGMHKGGRLSLFGLHSWGPAMPSVDAALAVRELCSSKRWVRLRATRMRMRRTGGRQIMQRPKVAKGSENRSGSPGKKGAPGWARDEYLGEGIPAAVQTDSRINY